MKNTIKTIAILFGLFSFFNTAYASYTKVDFGFLTGNPDTEYYVGYGGEECIYSKEIPTYFASASTPVTGYVEADSSCCECDVDDSKINLYIYTDSNKTNMIGQIDLKNSVDSGEWAPSTTNVVTGYNILIGKVSDNEYTFTVSSSN